MSTQPFVVTFGGWYQRTTLHLTEVYDLFARGSSKLKLSKKRLAKYYVDLGIDEATREVGSLEYVRAVTRAGIEIRYYEDGLYVFNAETKDIDSTRNLLINYFENVFEPAMSYIFSLGAPTPKVLANIKIHHPTVISLVEENHGEFEVDGAYGQVYSKIGKGDVTVYKTPFYIFVVSGKKEILRDLVETQIFFREFKDQLERYLDIHRNVWEEIADIKERGEITGGEVGKIRSKLDSYQKTIDLIKNRINQMGAYVGTRKSIAKSAKVEDELVALFQYKFETLSNTHAYIRELWSMTSNYLQSAIRIIGEIDSQSMNVSIKSLQLITAIGVIGGIMRYLTSKEFPTITTGGFVYFIVLIAATWAVNVVIVKYYKGRKYKIKFTERTKDI